MRVGAQMIDAMQAHMPRASKAELFERAEADAGVGRTQALGDSHVPARVERRHEARVCIAIGILLSPKVIIADEPTSALDVVVQPRSWRLSAGTGETRRGCDPDWA